MKFYLTVIICANLVGLTACEKKAETAKQPSFSLTAAQKLYQEGQFQSARNEIGGLLKVDPKSSNAHFLAGRIAESLGDFQTAVSEYVVADATGPGSNEARHAAAALLLRLHAYQQADEWIARCLSNRPNDKAMKSYRSLLEERLGNNRKARADAEAILAENKGDVIANAVLAEEALRRKDPAYALIVIEAGLSTDPSDKALLQLKAEAFSQQGAPEKAIEIYEALISANPTAPDYRLALAELLAKTAGVAAGEQILRTGVEATPGNIDMHMKLISFLARHRDRKTVVDELLFAITAAPEMTVYDIALAEVYARDSGFDAAAKVLHVAIDRTKPGVPHAAAQLALVRLLIAHNDIAAARPILEAMVKANPTDDEVLTVRGQLLLRDKNPNGAIQDFLAIAARQPSNAAVFASLAEAYLQNDRRTEAISALRRVLSLSPSDLGALRRIADVQISTGDVLGARRTVDDFLERNPESIEGRVIQIRLAIRSKDWTAAEVALAGLHRVVGSEPAATLAEAEIKEAQGQFLEAANLYRRLIAWKDDGPMDMSAAFAFARTSIAGGQSSQAQDVLGRLTVKVPPADRGPYDLILATLYDASGQSNEAQALIESAIKLAPAIPAPYLQAAALAGKKDKDKAFAALDRGMTAGAPKEPLLLARAGLQSSNGQIEDAIATYRELLRINPGSAIAANELTNLLADQKPLDKNSLRQAAELLQKNALFKNQAILDSLAWSDYRLGNFEKAKELLNLANADQSSNPQLRFHYGAVLVALGEDKRGQEIIRSTLKDTYPGRNEAEAIVRN
ncbi:tetratricopeptide repeat protein [Bradyrhizobium sp. BR13661]|uniref:tetratricopeptide repeat protein n=2 Tax=Pseudomonadota TaxID=1224 RepID=UPI002476D8EC|nr:tetratricopeptide repeat protein [Bradyrhizobium sp. BR13661]